MCSMGPVVRSGTGICMRQMLAALDPLWEAQQLEAIGQLLTKLNGTAPEPARSGMAMSIFSMVCQLSNQEKKDSILFQLSRRCIDLHLLAVADRVAEQIKRSGYRCDIYVALYRQLMAENENPLAFKIIFNVPYADTQLDLIHDYYQRFMKTGHGVDALLALDHTLRTEFRYSTRAVVLTFIEFIECQCNQSSELRPEALTSTLSRILDAVSAPDFESNRLFFCERMMKALMRCDLVDDMLFVSRRYGFFAELGFKTVGRWLSKKYSAEEFRQTIQAQLFSAEELKRILPEYVSRRLSRAKGDEVVSAVSLGSVLTDDLARDRFYSEIGPALASAYREDNMTSFVFSAAVRIILTSVHDLTVMNVFLLTHVPFLRKVDSFAILKDLIDAADISDQQKSVLLASLREGNERAHSTC